MPKNRVLIVGWGGFAQSSVEAFASEAEFIGVYLPKPPNGPGLSGSSDCAVFDLVSNPDVKQVILDNRIDLVLPSSLDWIREVWPRVVRSLGKGRSEKIAIFAPTGTAMKLERDRAFSMECCQKFGIPCPEWHFVENRKDATRFFSENSGSWVIKNPLCSSRAPLQATIHRTSQDAMKATATLDDSEGIFVQEFVAGPEVGHFAFVSGGHVQSIATNQEYKHEHDGNLGQPSGAPRGGLVQADPEDQYRLSEQLIKPLAPWFEETNFRGPVQVTAGRHNGRWHVLEYNVRIGVTSGPLFNNMLKNPIELIVQTANGERPTPKFKPGMNFGVVLSVRGDEGDVIEVDSVEPKGRFWWNHVAENQAGAYQSTGNRILDIAAFGKNLDNCIEQVYKDTELIQFPSKSFRKDIGRSMWPPVCN